MGSFFFLPYCAYLSFQQPYSARFICLATASLVYIIGVFGVTIGGNVPLNEALAVFDINNATMTDIATHRLGFEGPWNFLHGIRTLASVATLLLVVVACLSSEN